MRFIHLADVHLDTAFAGRSEAVSIALRAASRASFKEAVEAALRERVDALLIAGDLFDGERLSVQTERFLSEQLGRLGTAGIPIFYATGNHDPGGGNGATSRVTWPDNVRLIDAPEPVRLPVLRGDLPVGFLTGAGHPTSRVTEDLSRRFLRPEGRLPEVALLHTQVGGSRGTEGHDPYAPSELSRLTTSGFDYWALGHVHLRQTLHEAPGVHYPGNPLGRNPRETGAKGALLVDLSDRRTPSVRFLELGRIRWETLSLDDLTDLPHPQALARRIQRVWAETRAADPGLPGAQWILRVVLDGPSPLYRDLATEEGRADLCEGLVTALGLLDVEIRCRGLRSPIPLELHRERDDVLGEALRLAAQLADPQGPSPSARLGLSERELAAAGAIEPHRLDDYIRELLADADAALLDALLRPSDR